MQNHNRIYYINYIFSSAKSAVYKGGVKPGGVYWQPDGGGEIMMIEPGQKIAEQAFFLMGKVFRNHAGLSVMQKQKHDQLAKVVHFIPKATI